VPTTKGLAAQVFYAVAERDVNIEMLSAGASDVAYYFVVKRGHGFSNQSSPLMLF